MKIKVKVHEYDKTVDVIVEEYSTRVVIEGEERDRLADLLLKTVNDLYSQFQCEEKEYLDKILSFIKDDHRLKNAVDNMAYDETGEEAENKIDCRDKIINVLHSILAKLGANSEVLSTTGSFDDTLSDEEVLAMLQSIDKKMIQKPDVDALIKWFREFYSTDIHIDMNGIKDPAKQKEEVEKFVKLEQECRAYMQTIEKIEEGI